MIRYKSTRGDNKLYTFSQTILKGIAKDEGLLVPETIPHLTLNQLTKLTKKSYQERACFILNLFQTDLTKTSIKKIVNQAYSANFDTPDIAPLVHLKENQYLLELWHGPTSAFKDLALQIMPLLFLEAVKASRKNFKYLILTATSGDTGAAALSWQPGVYDVSGPAYQNPLSFHGYSGGQQYRTPAIHCHKQC